MPSRTLFGLTGHCLIRPDVVQLVVSSEEVENKPPQI
jgi:hypothetical protein